MARLPPRPFLSIFAVAQARAMVAASEALWSVMSRSMQPPRDPSGAGKGGKGER